MEGADELQPLWFSGGFVFGDWKSGHLGEVLITICEQVNLSTGLSVGGAACPVCPASLSLTWSYGPCHPFISYMFTGCARASGSCWG